uniref:small monomeric GTPase n=1 Tax=Chrysolophus pictus TaxID=9089 RepID=A0A8C3L0C0_CHRPC
MASMFGKPRVSTERPPQSSVAECNVAILGCRGAGKSALTVKFLTKRFISEYDPNLEDTYASEELVDQQPVLLKVMDTADQVRAGQRRCHGDVVPCSPAPLIPRTAPLTASATCTGPMPSSLSTALTTGGALRAVAATLMSSPSMRGAASARAPCCCWATSWTWSSTVGQVHQVRPCRCPLHSPQAGDQSRRDVPGHQVWVPVLRGVGVPGLRSGAARLPPGGAGAAARGRAQPSPAASLRRRGAALPGHGHSAWPGQLHHQHSVYCQPQGDPLGGPSQAGHCQVVAGSEQKKSAHAHFAKRFQDILRCIPSLFCKGLVAPGMGTSSH